MATFQAYRPFHHTKQSLDLSPVETIPEVPNNELLHKAKV